MGTGMKSSAILSFAVVLSFLVAPTMADLINLPLEPTNTGWPWNGYQRWKDIAGNLYEGPSPTADNSWRDNAYMGASVNVAYGVTGSQLTGTLTATGLKPNFAYQMKLEGSPGTTTNTTLAGIGRTDTGTGTGYLVFGYFVTDGIGDATVPFVTDSSYHVLHRTFDSTETTGTYGFQTWTTNDGPIIYKSFDPDPSSAWYGPGNPQAARVGVFGQWQSGRALPGTLFLPNGNYICKFVLTEESFHDTDGIYKSGSGIWSGAPGGSWASPFKGEISFTVVPLPGAVVLGVIGIGFANWRLRRRREA